MNYPKVSIITPVYNSASFLEETIISVINQNYPNLEYIIIDGGSTDGSVEIIKKYEKYLHYWISEKDNGMYDAIKKGFKKCSGEICGWINADDFLIKNSIFAIANIFSQFSNVNWITGNNTQSCELGYLKIQPSRKWSKYDFYTNDYRFIQQESTFWRKNIQDNFDFSKWDKIKYAGDFIMWLNYFKHEKLFTVDIALGVFRIRKEEIQLSSKFFNEYIEECDKALKEEISKLDTKTRITIFIYKYLKFLIKKISNKSKYIRTFFQINNNIRYNPKTNTFYFSKR